MFKASAPMKKGSDLVFKTKKHIQNHRETVPLKGRCNFVKLALQCCLGYSNLSSNSRARW